MAGTLHCVRVMRGLFLGVQVAVCSWDTNRRERSDARIETASSCTSEAPSFYAHAAGTHLYGRNQAGFRRIGWGFARGRPV
jgi:hypothetical protein